MPLSAAASIGHLDTFRELLKRGESVDIADEVCRTPLIIAALGGDEEIVRELLNRGTEADITDAFDRTSLSAAASNVERGRDELIKAPVLRLQEQAYHVSVKKNKLCRNLVFLRF
jgi:ankyrin repeat protein